MIFVRVIFLSATLLCSGDIYLFAQRNTTKEKINERLKQFRSDYNKSMQAGNPESMQAYYSDTIRLMPPVQKTIMGKDNSVRYYRAFSSRFVVHDFRRTEIEILNLGTQVMETGTFSLRLTVKNTSKEYTLKGKYLNLWVNAGNDDLMLITEAWNYDQYEGDIMPLLRFEEVPSIHEAMLPNVPVNNNISFQLAALNRLLDATVTQHDAGTWSLYYADDGMLMPSHHAICKGRKEIDDYIWAHVKELPVFEELDIRNDRVHDLGEFVVEYASHIASWRNGQISGVSTGKNIRVWRREPDHSLKLFRSIGMYD